MGEDVNLDRGFILQPSYRVESGRAVVHLWGRLEGGETFLIRDERTKPYFFIRSEDEALARKLGARVITSTDLRDFEEDPVSRVELELPSHTPPLRDRLHQTGIDTYEADVRFAIRYLIDRDIRGSVAVDGEWRPGSTTNRIYLNPEVLPSDWIPELKALSIDIETDYRTNRILSVAFFGDQVEEVILNRNVDQELPRNCVAVTGEVELLRRFSRRIVELDPDILTGWNVAGFDLRVMAERAAVLGVSLQLGRAPGPLRVQRARGSSGAVQVSIPGRVVLDGPALLRGAFIRMERQSLDFVARQVLGEGKTISGSDRAETILRLFNTDLPRFAEYNLTDARLALEILRHFDLVDLSVARSRLTGMPIDRVASSIAAFDFLYLQKLRSRRRVAPTSRVNRVDAQAFGGGHVFEPMPGLHDLVVVLDFKSLYPSLIRTFQVDPLGFVPNANANDNTLVAPNGAAFRRERGILAELLDELSPERERAKREGRTVESLAIKILMNSFYGVLGTPMCRFYNPEIAEAITSFGRHLLRWSRDRLQSWGLEVLYGDTDSLFIASGAGSRQEAGSVGRRLAEKLNQSLTVYIQDRWQTESRLEAEFEKLFVRLFLPPIRGGVGGARKRYAGLVETDRGTEVVFTGLEAVRRDWTDLARDAQHELYDRFFHDRPIETYLRRLIDRLRNGELDDRLIYNKALRKPLDAYVSTTPPHVAAARKMTSKPGRLISYVMTDSGPEPVADRTTSIDYQHYVDKQLRPIAEPILAELGQEFSKVIGDDRQLDLF